MKFLTKHMQEIFEKDPHPNFMAYGYMQQFVRHYDHLTDKQLDRAFDMLNKTDKYILKVDEEILIDLFDKVF